MDKQWICAKCNNQNLPFFYENPDDLVISNLGINNVSENFKITPDIKFNDFISECNLFTNSINNNNEDDFGVNELPSNINSNYYSYLEFNKIKINQKSTLGLIHTNLAPINKQIGDLNVTLSLLNYNFDIIGITEHKI